MEIQVHGTFTGGTFLGAEISWKINFWKLFETSDSLLFILTFLKLSKINLTLFSCG